jgi:hypothetical protein
VKENAITLNTPEQLGKASRHMFTDPSNAVHFDNSSRSGKAQRLMSAFPGRL